MTNIEVITIVIAVSALLVAIYGAGLSTFLGLRELKKEKRQIDVYFELVEFEGRGRLVIVNTGYRPITITNASIVLFENKDGRLVPTNDFVPMNIVLLFEEGEGFPFILKDGEHKYININDALKEEIWVIHHHPQITVFDAEGHVYWSKSVRVYNQKSGANMKM